jgi:hypothetical protein
MRLFTKLLSASAIAALALGTASAASASVYISFDGSTTLAGGTFADGNYTFTANCVPAANCGGFNAVGVSGDTGTLPTLLHSQNVDATTKAGAAADLTVWVTRNNILNADFVDFASTFTSNNSFNSKGKTPFTVTMSTYIDPTNHLFGGTFVSSYSSNLPGSDSDNDFATLAAPGHDYSVTEKYVIHANAFKISESTSPSIIFEGLGNTVPEPATWAMMLVGFGGMGALLRNRRRMAAVAA